MLGNRGSAFCRRGVTGFCAAAMVTADDASGGPGAHGELREGSTIGQIRNFDN